MFNLYGLKWPFRILVFLLFFGVYKFSIWVSKPKEFIVTKDMKAEKRIVTNGVIVDTVLVYKFNK